MVSAQQMYRLVQEALINEFPFGSKGLLFTGPINGCARIVGVGTGVDRTSGARWMAPTISVRLIELEEIYVSISTAKPRPRIEETSTLSTQIGYLEPRNSYHQWWVHDEVGIDAVIADMRRAILTFGPRLWDRYSTKEAIFNAIERGEHIWPSSRPYVLPIVYGMMGRMKEAALFMTETETRMKGSNYDQFVHNWYEHFMTSEEIPRHAEQS
jgi:hypothetical protein